MVVVEGVKYPTPCKKGEIVQGKLTREIRLEKEYVQGRGGNVQIPVCLLICMSLHYYNSSGTQHLTKHLQLNIPQFSS